MCLLSGHQTTVSKFGVRKKPPTAKRSVPFGIKLKSKRQHTEPYPVSFSKEGIENNVTISKLESDPGIETELGGESSVNHSIDNKDQLDDDAASDKTIENYPHIKTEPVDNDLIENPEYEVQFDNSVTGIDTSNANGENIEETDKLNVSSEDQTPLFENDNNASVKLEYADYDHESGVPSGMSQDEQEESVTFDYGTNSGTLSEHQLFFSHAESTPTSKCIYLLCVAILYMILDSFVSSDSKCIGIFSFIIMKPKSPCTCMYYVIFSKGENYLLTLTTVCF